MILKRIHGGDGSERGIIGREICAKANYNHVINFSSKRPILLFVFELDLGLLPRFNLSAVLENLVLCPVHSDFAVE